MKISSASAVSSVSLSLASVSSFSTASAFLSPVSFSDFGSMIAATPSFSVLRYSPVLDAFTPIVSVAAIAIERSSAKSTYAFFLFRDIRYPPTYLTPSIYY